MREVAEELGVICVETDLRFLGCVPMEQVFGRLQLLRGRIFSALRLGGYDLRGGKSGGHGGRMVVHEGFRGKT